VALPVAQAVLPAFSVPPPQEALSFLSPCLSDLWGAQPLMAEAKREAFLVDSRNPFLCLWHSAVAPERPVPAWGLQAAAEQSPDSELVVEALAPFAGVPVDRFAAHDR
jgi:hypothetical protein